MEARGVEPLSEDIFTQVSPSASDHLHSLDVTPVGMLHTLVAFKSVTRPKAKAHSRSPLNDARAPNRGISGSDGYFKLSSNRFHIIVSEIIVVS